SVWMITPSKTKTPRKVWVPADRPSHIRLLIRHGWVTKARARKTLKWSRSASKQDVSNGIRYLTTHYFDRDSIASDSIRRVNAQAEYNADVYALVRAGKVPTARAGAFKKRAADSAGVDDFRSAISGMRAKYLGVEFPTVRELRLPR